MTKSFDKRRQKGWLAKEIGKLEKLVFTDVPQRFARESRITRVWTYLVMIIIWPIFTIAGGGLVFAGVKMIVTQSGTGGTKSAPGMSVRLTGTPALIYGATAATIGLLILFVVGLPIWFFWKKYHARSRPG